MSNRPTLQEIHRRGTGKTSDKWDIYLEIYDELLSRYRDKQISLLEIGVQNGGSLETWSTYFENAKAIVGCDIDHNCQHLHFADERIQVVIGDATDSETSLTIEKVSGSFDIVIEDGSHTSRDIVATFNKYFSRVRPGGIYIAEDLHCCYWQEWGGGLASSKSGIEYFKSLVDCINSKHWHRSDISQVEYINKFAALHESSASDELLDSIFSIEFYDSICVVRKALENRLSRIESRVFGGNEESVNLCIRQLGKALPIHPQPEQEFSSLVELEAKVSDLLDENRSLSKKVSDMNTCNMEILRELSGSKGEVQELAEELLMLRESFSWRLTAPLRLIKVSIRRAIRREF